MSDEGETMTAEEKNGSVEPAAGGMAASANATVPSAGPLAEHRVPSKDRPPNDMGDVTVAGLPAITYKPGWSFQWEHYDSEPHLFLAIGVTGPDAKGIDADDLTARSVTFKFAVPEPFDPAWLFNRLAGIEDHEIREWLAIDGVKVFEPHGDTGGAMNAKRSTADVFRPRRSVGDAKDPSFEWVGGKRVYVWVADGTRCLMTISAAEARQLRDWLTAHVNGTQA